MKPIRNGVRWKTNAVEFGCEHIAACGNLIRSPRLNCMVGGIGASQFDAFGNSPDGMAGNSLVRFQQVPRRDELAGHETFRRVFENGSCASFGGTHRCPDAKPNQLEQSPS